jgi:hypothetical protein
MGVLKFGGGFAMSHLATRGRHGSSRTPCAKSSTSGCANVDLQGQDSTRSTIS